MDEALPAALDGERIDRVVAVLTGRSRSAVRRYLADGLVTHNGVVATVASTRVSEGDVVAVDLPDEPESDPRPVPRDIDLDVVHEDGDIVVIDKPVGLVVHPGAGHRDDTLVNGLLARWPAVSVVGDPARPGIVHRLDRDTSGLLVCALTAQAYDGLVAQLATRTMGRSYLALVHGHPDSERGRIEAPIGRSPRARTQMAVVEGGRPARTDYECLERFGRPIEAALLRCSLHTGRTHQIRVHLRAVGLPLLGDPVYGRRDPFGVARPLLHAAELRVHHPVSGEELVFSSQPPADFAGSLAGFRAESATSPS